MCWAPVLLLKQDERGILSGSVVRTALQKYHSTTMQDTQYRICFLHCVPQLLLKRPPINLKSQLPLTASLLGNNGCRQVPRGDHSGTGKGMEHYLASDTPTGDDVHTGN